DWRIEPNGSSTVRLVTHREFRFEPQASAGSGPGAGPDGGTPSSGGEATIEYRKGSPVLDSQTAAQPRSASGNVVPDIRVRMTVHAEASAEVEIVWKPGDGREHALRVVTSDRGTSTLRTKGTTGALSKSLEA